MIAVTAAARGFGYVREAVIAAAFGASREVDLFLAALTIPALIMATVYYSIPNSFIPLWVDSARPRRFVHRAAATVLAVSLIATILTGVLAEPLMRILAGGFSPMYQSQAAALLRIASGAIFFATVEAILRSRLLAAKAFGLPSLSYVWQGLGIIVGIVGWREQGAYAMIWGFLAGTAAAAGWNALILIGGTTNTMTGATAPFPGARAGTNVWLWISVVFLADSLAQFYGLVDRRLGSYLEPGTIAALNYASLVASLPSAIIGVALSTAIFPFLSDAVAGNETDRARAIIDRAVSWSLVFGIPCAVWLIAFRGEITSLLFQRGAFDSRAQEVTSSVLAALALGIVPATLAVVWARMIYAARRWAFLLTAAVLALVIKTLCSIWWVSVWGLVGLAFATVTAQVVAAAFIAWKQRENLRGSVRGWTNLTFKISVLVGIPSLVTLGVLSTWDPGSPAERLVVSALGILAGVSSLLVIGTRWGIDQMNEIRDAMKSAVRGVD
jgi:putative peptidoglycan lipid II flippase